jgi:hypothetical protein
MAVKRDMNHRHGTTRTDMVMPATGSYAPARTSGGAITALVLAGASFLVLPLFPAIAALFVASSARKAIVASGGATQGANLCRIATIVAWVNIGLVAVAMLVLLPVGTR